MPDQRQSTPVHAPYLSNAKHKLLRTDLALAEGGWTGRSGNNVTLVVMAQANPEAALITLQSIAVVLPTFKGEIAVLVPATPMGDALTTSAPALPTSIRWIRCSGNWAKGLNEVLSHMATPWALCVDAGLAFTADPFLEIFEAIGQLGVNFLNLPVLGADQMTPEAYGGVLTAQAVLGNTLVGVDNAAPDSLEVPFLSTFLHPCAFALQKAAFRRSGPFDEQLDQRLSHLDYSLRLFRDGIKLGNLPTYRLTREAGPTTAWTVDGESSPGFQAGSQHFLEAYNLQIGTVNARTQIIKSHTEPKAASDKPRIGLVTDTNNWAFANIARQIKKNLSDRFEIEIVALANDCDHMAQIFVRFRDFDLVHFFWRDLLTLVDSDYFRGYFTMRGWDPKAFLDKFQQRVAITTSVYDHLFLSDEEIQKRKNLYNHLAPRYTVCSERLNRIYREIELYPDPSWVIEDGVDLELFYPQNLERFDDLDRDLVIGWAGNSKWNADNGDFKGLETLVKPAIKALTDEGLRIKSFFADRAESYIPHHAMVDYYSQIDIFVCASLIEGTPNPALEAMACGVPVVSTDVGIVPELFGPKQQEFILPERTLEQLIAKLRRLILDHQLRRDLSAENRAVIRNWAWASQTQKFAAFFEFVLSDKQRTNQARSNSELPARSQAERVQGKAERDASQRYSMTLSDHLNPRRNSEP